MQKLRFDWTFDLHKGIFDYSVMSEAFAMYGKNIFEKKSANCVSLNKARILAFSPFYSLPDFEL